MFGLKFPLNLGSFSIHLIPRTLGRVVIYGVFGPGKEKIAPMWLFKTREDGYQY